MNADTNCRSTTVAGGDAGDERRGIDGSATLDGRTADVERDVDYVVDDCFFAVGQVVGTRKTLEYDAVVWWREHYRAKFLAAMQAFGNRWSEDRQNVTGVAFMLAERAMRYSNGLASINVDCARKAAVDVERYCAIHARRAARARSIEAEMPMIAGYWCTDFPATQTRPDGA